MSNVNDIFNTVATIDQLGSGNQFLRDEFNPSAKNSKSGTYTALIKFVTWYKNPQKPIVSKFESYLTDPITKQGRVVDSLKNFSSSCPINDTYWTLQNTNNVQLQALAKKHINTYNTFAALVQIIKDDVHPENNGKILVWRFKKTIYEKITNEITPQFGTNPHPFDIINGRYFAVNVNIKNNYNNYDNCQFVNAASSGLYIKDATGNFVQIDANCDRQIVYDYLVANSPDLDAYLPKEWDEKTSAFVTNALNNINALAQGGGMAGNIAGAITPTMPTTSPLTAAPIAVATTSPMVVSVSPTQEVTMTNITSQVSSTPTPNVGAINAFEPTSQPVLSSASNDNNGISGIDLPPMPNITNTPSPKPVGLGLGLDEITGML